MAVVTVKDVAERINKLEEKVNTDLSNISNEFNDLRRKVYIFIETMQNKLEPKMPSAPQQEQLVLDNRNEPWRLDFEEFAAYRDTVEANWADGGNVKTGKALAKTLNRVCGHSEGQLYIDWAKKSGRAAVKAFWISRGFRTTPTDL